ncbi:hypothetical protein TELCIR_21383, partial [Teladorsagia circumcincta]
MDAGSGSEGFTKEIVGSEGGWKIVDAAMSLDNKILAYRFIGCATLAFSAVAALSICVTLPMVSEYVSSIKMRVNRDVTYCK